MYIAENDNVGIGYFGFERWQAVMFECFPDLVAKVRGIRHSLVGNGFCTNVRAFDLRNPVDEHLLRSRPERERMAIPEYNV